MPSTHRKNSQNGTFCFFNKEQKVGRLGFALQLLPNLKCFLFVWARQNTTSLLFLALDSKEVHTNQEKCNECKDKSVDGNSFNVASCKVETKESVVGSVCYIFEIIDVVS